MFKRLSDAAPTVRVTVSGTALDAPAGESVAALLLVHAKHTFRTTAVSESPRAPYCMMGVCHDCLVEIDGVPYWDGGYMGNPVLFPFFNSCESSDVVLVQITPIERKTTPRTAREILNRVNEITFNSSLLKELRAIEFVARLVDDGKLDPADYKQVLLHRIDAVEEMAALSASSKLNAEWAFLVHLRDIGRAAASRWLERHYDRIGEGSSVNIRTFFD